MAELRKDPITGRWVIISTKRGKRPASFMSEKRAKLNSRTCPFCYGNEKIIQKGWTVFKSNEITVKIKWVLNTLAFGAHPT